MITYLFCSWKINCKNEMIICTLCLCYLNIFPKMWRKLSAKSFSLKPSATEAKSQKTSASAEDLRPSVDPWFLLLGERHYYGKVMEIWVIILQYWNVRNIRGPRCPLAFNCNVGSVSTFEVNDDIKQAIWNLGIKCLWLCLRGVVRYEKWWVLRND